MDSGSLSTLETETVRSGLRFLFDQATDLLRRRANRRERDQVNEMGTASDPVLDGELSPVPADEVPPMVVGALAERRRLAADYLDGVLPMSPGDPRMLQVIEDLRQALEAALAQYITFRGEEGRPRTGAPLAGQGSAVAHSNLDIDVSGERAVGVNFNHGSIETGDKNFLG